MRHILGQSMGNEVPTKRVHLQQMRHHQHKVKGPFANCKRKICGSLAVPADESSGKVPGRMHWHSVSNLIDRKGGFCTSNAHEHVGEGDLEKGGDLLDVTPPQEPEGNEHDRHVLRAQKAGNKLL